MVSKVHSYSQPVLCIMGPTAAGKTALAIDLAERCNGELISVDSALVYRGLDIGAAKPHYPHHLIDIRDPSEPYSAADFVNDAVRCVDEIRARGRLPIFVGGTMLYYRALFTGLDEMPASNPAVREAIEARARDQGWPGLHAELARVDPVLADKLHPNHSQRISRGLEVWEMTGKPLSEWQTGRPEQAISGELLPLAICPSDRRVLHAHIERRFDAMLDAGFVDEVRRLHDRGDLSVDLPAVRAVGYRQMWSWLDGEITFDEARERAVAATRQLAKRQLTWLRGWSSLTWLKTDNHGSPVIIEPAGVGLKVKWPEIAGNGGEKAANSLYQAVMVSLTRWLGNYHTG